MILNQLFTNGAIFQAQKPVPVFGEASGCITVEFAGQVKKASAINGHFTVMLDPMPYGGPYSLCVTGDGETVKLDDIYVGEVYLIAGQSNMQFKLQDSSYPVEKYCDEKLLRFFTTERIEKGEPHTPADGWVAVTRDKAGSFSAIGVLVGEMMRKKTGAAVGIITCYQGASVIESWMPFEVASQPRFTIPEEEKSYDHHCPYYLNWNHPGRLFDFTFRSIAPYATAAVIWYQGESDVCESEAKIYKDELLAMIEAWRDEMDDSMLKFIIIQIADLLDSVVEIRKVLQQAQADAANPEKNIFTVISRDVCENNDIHPKTKDLLAARIAELL